MNEKASEVHITDVNTFMTCRRKWWFSSMMRLGLQPVQMAVPLVTGICAHKAMEDGYNNGQGPLEFRVDQAVRAVETYVKERMELTESRFPHMLRVIEPQLAEMDILVRGMVKHYSMWVRDRSLDRNLELVGMEHKFNIPIPDTDLTYAGRFDGFVRGKKSGELYLLEFKTARSLQSAPSTMRGMQCAAYLWAASQIMDEPVRGMIYRFLRKKVPDDPILLKSGSWSMRKKQSTTASWVAQWPDTTELQAMLHSEQQGNPFFMQQLAKRSDIMRENALEAIRQIGLSMADQETVIFPWSGYHCNWCDFRNPCNLMNAGHSITASLEANYAKRIYWENEEKDE